MTNQFKGITKDEFFSVVGSLRGKYELLISTGKFEGRFNDFLRSIYAGLEGTKEFNSFKGWKEKGFKVKKGEKAYRVFSAPKKKKIGEYADGKEMTKEFFYQACIFSENQVEAA
jgi:hypothetical protein